MARLAGKAALVTGASRGIGRAIAQSMGREGAEVIVNFASDRESAEAVVADIMSSGGRAEALQADITDPNAVRALFDHSENSLGGLDIVVVSAHPGLGHGAITQLQDDAIDQQLAVFKGQIITLQEAGRRVRDNGTIICISSSATRLANPEVALYASLKLALEQLARGLSRELASRGVRVVSIAPGLTRTDRVIGLDFGPAQFCDPEDIASVAVFAASEAAKWVNTTTIYVNGGATYAQ